MSNHFELTNQEKTLSGITLYRIRATRDLPHTDVKAGDLGGWVEKVENLSGNAWVYDNARVHGNAWVYDNARVHGNAWVYDNARVHGNAKVYDNARVYGEAWVYDNARVHGNARVSGEAHVCSNTHIITVTPVGSENVTATLHRTKDGHALHVGCWENGTLETLMEEVERRSEMWFGSETEKEAWKAQYEALHAMGTATVKMWEER